MVQVECRTCKRAHVCERKGERHRRVAFAWCNGRPIEDCGDYAPRWWRGVSGVLDLPEPPPSDRPR